MEDRTFNSLLYFRLLFLSFWGGKVRVHGRWLMGSAGSIFSLMDILSFDEYTALA